jgi:hypothetical protein
LDYQLRFHSPFPSSNIEIEKLYVLDSPQKVTKTAYLKTIMLLFKTLTIVSDQIIDIILVATLFIVKEYWFAVVYLAVDLFPAAVIMWQKFQTEKSWRVLVCFIC